MSAFWHIYMGIYGGGSPAVAVIPPYDDADDDVNIRISMSEDANIVTTDSNVAKIRLESTEDMRFD